jgi:capsid protein
MIDPYAKHPFTKESLAGTGYSNSVKMPESRLRMLRRLCRTCGKRGTIGPAIIGTRVELACGDGLTLSATPKAKNADKIATQAEELWSYYIEDRAISSCGLFGIHEYVRGIAESAHHNGDVYVVARYSSSLAKRTGFGTFLDAISGASICNPNGRTNSGRLWNGIEYDSKWRARYIHYIARIEDNSPKWEKLDLFTENFVRVETPFRREEGINRSLPLLTPVLDEVNLLESFRKAYITKAVMNSKMTLLSEGLPNLDYQFTDATDIGDPSFIPFEDGTIVQAPAGGTIKPIAEASPTSDAVQFSKAYAAEISSSCFVPIEIILKSFDRSYSAGTGSLNECWRVVKVDRSEIAKIYRLAYNSVMKEGWVNGYIDAPGFNSSPIATHNYCLSIWSGTPRGSLNPLADYKARQLGEQMGWLTGAINAAELGYKRKNNIEIRKKESAELREINGI